MSSPSWVPRLCHRCKLKLLKTQVFLLPWLTPLFCVVLSCLPLPFPASQSRMGIPRALLVLCIATAFLSLGPRGSLGRSHLRKRQQSHGRRGNGGHRLQSPVDSPADPPAAGTSTTVTPSNSSSDSFVFDVRSFGAVGDGVTDDTEAFRSAWRAACSVESATLFVPSDGVFMITSTIFPGPCQPGLVFQVILRTKITCSG